jgi:hypothetical protein
LVQTFEPINTTDFVSIIEEDDYFRHGIFKERVLWLAQSHIVHDIKYDTLQNEVDGFESRVYRIFTTFTNSSDAIEYKLRWV